MVMSGWDRNGSAWTKGGGQIMADLPTVKVYERPQPDIKFGVVTGLRVKQLGCIATPVSFMVTRKA